MEPSVHATDADLPLACTLGATDGPAHMRRWQVLVKKGRPTARRSGHRLEVRYEAKPGVRHELEALVAAEQQCCSFVRWDLSQDGRHLVLHVTADPARPSDVAAVAGLFGAD